MTGFELIKREVTARDAAKLYGLRFDRSGRGFCPFHDDGKHAALKFFDDGGFYCHACHVSGDATAIVAQMLGVDAKVAAEQIRRDFHLDQPTTSRPDPSTKARAKQRRDDREALNRLWDFLCSVIHEANKELPRYDPEAAWNNPRFVSVLEARTRADMMLNQLWEMSKNGA